MSAVADAGAHACWRLERQRGDVIYPSIRLAPGGEVVGSSHENESHWSLDGSELRLLTRDGRVSSVFDTVADESGQVCLVGRFVLDPRLQIVHRLVRTRLHPKVRGPGEATKREEEGKRFAEGARLINGLFGGRFDSLDVLTLAQFDAALSSARYYQAHMLTAPNLAAADELMTLAADHVSLEGLVAEFGVASGRTVNQIARLFPERQVYGFDVFSGLPESWRTGFAAGAFHQSALPSVEANVELVVGLFEQTLPAFVRGHDEPVALLHVDCDLYSGAKTVFSQLGSRLRAGSIVVFDEYFNYPGWQQHEFLAWKEYCAETGMRYEYIGFVSAHQQVAIRCLGR